MSLTSSCYQLYGFEQVKQCSLILSVKWDNKNATLLGLWERVNEITGKFCEQEAHGMDVEPEILHVVKT